MRPSASLPIETIALGLLDYFGTDSHQYAQKLCFFTGTNLSSFVHNE